MHLVISVCFEQCIEILSGIHILIAHSPTYRSESLSCQQQVHLLLSASPSSACCSHLQALYVLLLVLQFSLEFFAPKKNEQLFYFLLKE